jgi:hypothetical protein
MTTLPQSVFAQRASFYTTSAVHKDKVVLDRLVELAHMRPTDRVLMLPQAPATPRSPLRRLCMT